MHFEAIGTVTRCVLGPPWARYLIGRYTILPNGDAYLPVAWYRVFLAAADEVLRAVGARRAA
jgi:hypothetical protein